MTEAKEAPIGLVLSGGGVRAMAFHLGVMKLLAERGLLEAVSRVSTVSGGSLLVGLVLQGNGLRWPSSGGFLCSVYPTIRSKLCERSLQWGALRQLGAVGNLRFLLSRANLLALALKHEWGISARLIDLPVDPEWSINGTTAETGKRFRFKSTSFGDYTLGYAEPGDFPLADALAVSAAFPGGFGPLAIDAAAFVWRKRHWEDPVGTERPVEIGHARLHLYDGGVYDNLGLEPFFDAGRGESKLPGLRIVVSDAGAPLPSGFASNPLSVFRLKRVADIMGDQSHALRVRTFAKYLQQAAGRGSYISIATPVSASRPCRSAEFAAGFPTTLRRLERDEFDRLAEHGYLVASQVERLYGLA